MERGRLRRVDVGDGHVHRGVRPLAAGGVVRVREDGEPHAEHRVGALLDVVEEPFERGDDRRRLRVLVHAPRAVEDDEHVDGGALHVRGRRRAARERIGRVAGREGERGVAERARGRGGAGLGRRARVGVADGARLGRVRRAAKRGERDDARHHRAQVCSPPSHRPRKSVRRGGRVGYVSRALIARPRAELQKARMGQRNSRAMFVGVGALGLAAPFAGCVAQATPVAAAADDSNCSAKLCPNDAPPTNDYVNNCNALLRGSCGVQYRALIDCYATSAVCDSTGHTDVGATEGACASQASAFDQCAPAPDAGFGGG